MTAVDVAALRRELAGSLEGEVRFDALARALYSTDASVYQIQPVGVVVPKSREDLVRVVKACRQHRCSITMRGGGTSQAGQAIGEGLVVDTSKYFNRLIEVNAAERWARVEPGIVLDELNAALARHGLRFAPDISTASRATVGGMLSNNSAGARSLIYGKTIDHVLEVQVLLADGTFAWFRPVGAEELDRLCRETSLEGACYRETRQLAHACAGEIELRFPKILRRVGGYNLDEFVDAARPFNLTKLIVGSEGTLGVVVEARINLVPLPKAKAVLVIQFEDFLESLEATPAILRHQPSAVEVMDAFILDHTRQSPDLHRHRQTFVEGEPAALLCVEFYGEHADDLPPRIEALELDLGARLRIAIPPRVRAGGTTGRLAGPRSRPRPGDGDEGGCEGGLVRRGHCRSAGEAPRLHPGLHRARPPPRHRGGRVRTRVGRMPARATGRQHEDRRGRPAVRGDRVRSRRPRPPLRRRAVRRTWRWTGAKPVHGAHVWTGAVRRVSPHQEHVRSGRSFQPRQDRQRSGHHHESSIWSRISCRGRGDPLRLRRTWGLPGAVEMCSGLGACRKGQSGTMCPSFMVTREEQHSTRGRANALRLALSGKLGKAGLADDAVRDVLDLCLECRACKSECPVGVDVARMKSEFLAAYWRRRGTSAQARVLGHVDELARWGSRLAPLSNVLARSRLVQYLNERMLGLDRRRTAPAWVRPTFREQVVRRHPQRGEGVAVALFVDTFTNHQHPSVGVAGLEVIERLGYGVTLAPNLCCGRPLISQGLLDDAQRRARENAERLLPIAEAGRPIVFFEPSCLSAVREDAPDLLGGEARRKALAVAARSQLFEEWLESEYRSGAATAVFRPGPATVVLHGHCHQKAMGALPPAKALLARIPGAAVVDPDAGCCGMAGSFGYLP